MDKRYIAYQWVSQDKYDSLITLFNTWKTLVDIGLLQSPQRVFVVTGPIPDTQGTPDVFYEF